MNASDRELLEMAAKAAGLEISNGEPFEGVEGEYLLLKAKGGCLVEWNPLTDDGDAFRLAVQLSMKTYRGEAYAWQDDAADYLNGACVSEDECPCPFEATRRAIVQMAAEIGKEGDK